MKFKVGDKIALATHPDKVLYIITKVINNMTYDCISISGNYFGLIDRNIIHDWVIAHDDNYRVDKILTKYNAL